MTAMELTAIWIGLGIIFLVLHSRIQSFFRWNCRRIDMGILWPACVLEAPDLDHARAAFFTHMELDSAWQCIPREERIAFVDSLTAESREHP